jgi:nucleotide-binding universal stress UspA family protein
VFKHILVPIDLSDRNARTLATALELARQNGARVTLLHVIHGLAGVGRLQGFYRRLVKTSRRELDRVAKRFASQGVSVSAEVCIEEPAREIVRAAAKNKVDLMVMGSHKVNPARGRGWAATRQRPPASCSTTGSARSPWSKTAGRSAA